MSGHLWGVELLVTEREDLIFIWVTQYYLNLYYYMDIFHFVFILKLLKTEMKTFP